MNLLEISSEFCINYLSCLKKVAYKMGLTESQALCLNAIPFNGISQVNLAKKLSIDISTISRNLDKLNLLGLIQKQMSLTDKRSKRVKLTEKGEQVFKKFKKNVFNELNPIYQKLDLKDISTLEEILNKLNWQLEMLNQ